MCLDEIQNTRVQEILTLTGQSLISPCRAKKKKKKTHTVTTYVLMDVLLLSNKPRLYSHLCSSRILVMRFLRFEWNVAGKTDWICSGAVKPWNTT